MSSKSRRRRISVALAAAVGTVGWISGAALGSTDVWTNQAGTGNWSTSPTDENWSIGGVQSAFTNSDNVIFDDTAGAGNTSVDLSGTLGPASILVDDQTLNYSLFGSGVIGTGNLTKIGAGMLTLSITGGDFSTGATTISQGVLNLDSAGETTVPMGGNSPVSVGGGTLLFTGGSTALTEQLDNTTLNPGASVISVNDTGSSATLNLGQLIPLTGATVQFKNSSNGAIVASSFVGGGLGTGNILTTATGAPIGVIGTNWAKATGSTNATIVPLLSYYSPQSGTSALNTFALANFDIVNPGEMRASGPAAIRSIRFNTPLGGYYVGSSINYPVFSASAGTTVLDTNSIKYDQIYTNDFYNFSVGGFLMMANTGTNNVYISSQHGLLTGVASTAPYRSLSFNAGNEITFIQQNTIAGMYLLAGISDQNGTAIVKDGAGTVYSSAYAPTAAIMTNLWQGPTYINGGTWAIANDTGLGGVATTAVQMTNPVILNGGTLQALGTFALNTGAGSNDRPVLLGANGGSFDVTSASGTPNVLTVSGVVSGVGGLTKSDSGTLVLSGSNSYSGGTIINGGTLSINGNSALGSGPVTVNNGGALGGGGLGASSVVGATTVNGGGSVVPGDPTNLTFQNGLTLNNGAGLTYTLNTAGISNEGPLGGNDLVTVNNALKLGTGITVNINPLNDFSDGTYVLAHYGSLVDNSSDFSGWTADFTGGEDQLGTFSFFDDTINDNVDLIVVNVPEPGSLALLGIAGVGLLRRSKRVRIANPNGLPRPG